MNNQNKFKQFGKTVFQLTTNAFCTNVTNLRKVFGSFLTLKVFL